MSDLPKAYDPKAHEDYIYNKWMESGFYNPDICIEKGITDKNAKSFTIVLPPPNVTGVLHLGHAVMLAIEDAMIRYHRMKGDKTLWVPGVDHAAIATQSKVEGQLYEKEGKTRHDLGRDKFLKRVEKYAQESHDTIVGQMKKMGASIDWSREAFTLDKERTKAVRTAFKRMYDDRLIYRGYRVVNWDPKGQTTVSDDEVEYREGTAKLYTFKYSKDFPISISTTRPETKFGDTAVAVNPKDKRYKKYIGKTFENVQFVGTSLTIKIIGDREVDMNYGTGALGVTPAHSIIDSQIALRHDLPMVTVIDEDALMTGEAGDDMVGKSTLEARKNVVKWLEREGLLESAEEITQNLSYAQRSGGIIEPLPKLQWFINVTREFERDGKKSTLKSLMQDAVKSGDIKIIPERFDKTYFHWIDNLRDWCISRQIWYGHRIPVWYCTSCDGEDAQDKEGVEVIVGVQDVDICNRCNGKSLVQDSDTLDTWFSSGIWTFSTLGWPEKTQDLMTYHPTSVLETGYDILFFWVARMILMTKYLLGEVPFHTVYLHGLIRDEKGRKMSKTLGNVIDPLDMIEKYGTDATRLSLMIGSTPGNDMKLSEDKVAGFRNFTNKLWNIARFVLSTTDESVKSAITQKEYDKLLWEDQWILGRLSIVSKEVSSAFESYEFSKAGELLRDFTWNEFADWYIEISKIKGEKDIVLRFCLEILIKLWHPFMPFVTEHIWKQLGKDSYLMVASWPSMSLSLNKESESTYETVSSVVTTIRTLRNEQGVDPKQKINAFVSAGKNTKTLQDASDLIKKLARLEKLEVEKKLDQPKDTLGAVCSSMSVYISRSVSDTSSHKARIQKEIDNVNKYIQSLEKKLQDTSFVNGAPKNIVEDEKDKLTEAKERLNALQDQIKNL